MTIKELLEDHRCRTILHYLKTHNKPVTIEAMIEQLTLQESDVYPSDTAAERAEQVTIAVWTIHLPALAEHDIVRYDRQSGMVRWWRNAGQLTTHLEDPPDYALQEE
ncbi:DUF7344 domain-containing protein [Haladaptatus halobius]|uniref:DUF7344 domain-containing protein n=1 Tax=Haladaptatus halobius TaxID=2884875 RepID=UPI003F615AF5